MKAQKIEHMFNFSYEKSSEEIRASARTKVAVLKAKIDEREARIVKVRAEYKITDSILIDLLNQARRAAQAGAAMSHYSYSNHAPREDAPAEEVIVGAGVINGLMTERDFIEAEKSQIEKLELINRNLKDLVVLDGGKEFVKGHKLDHEELKYLGF